MKTQEKKIEKILVGVDFSEASRRAVVEAIHLANQQQSLVRVLHIIEESMTEALQKYSQLDRNEIVASVTERLEAFCREIGEDMGRLTCEVIVGHSVKDFGNACDRISPDLVVLGAFGSQSHGHSATGTTVKQIIQECKTDVLLMRPGSEQFSHVLACIDFSDYDVPIIRAADQLCLAEEGQLEILHVYYPAWKNSHLADKDAVEISPDFEVEYKAVLQGKLDALVPLNIHGVPIFQTKTSVIEHQDHCEGILEHIRETKVNVVVIGARGQSRIESMILGRIAERIVTESLCSVYIVKSAWSGE